MGDSGGSEVIRWLHEQRLLDYAMPAWLNYRHIKEDRLFLPLDEFLNQLEEGSRGYVFVPSSEQDVAIPVTEMELPIKVGHEVISVPFIATVRPFSHREIYDQDNDLEVKWFYNAKREGDWNFSEYAAIMGLDCFSKAQAPPSITELEQVIANEKNSDVFYPHIIGVKAWSHDQTVIMYGLNGKTVEGQRFMDLISFALREEGLAEFFFPRDSDITLRNRLKYSLYALIEEAYVYPNGHYLSTLLSQQEEYLRKVSVDGVQHRLFSFENLRRTFFEDVAGSYGPAAAYIPVVLPSFPEGVIGKEVSMTVPVALCNVHPYTGEPGLFNYGMCLGFQGSEPSGDIRSFSVSPWRSLKVAREISGIVGEIIDEKVVPIYMDRPKAKSLIVDEKR